MITLIIILLTLFSVWFVCWFRTMTKHQHVWYLHTEYRRNINGSWALTRVLRCAVCEETKIKTYNLLQVVMESNHNKSIRIERRLMMYAERNDNKEPIDLCFKCAVQKVIHTTDSKYVPCPIMYMGSTKKKYSTCDFCGNLIHDSIDVNI